MRSATSRRKAPRGSAHTSCSPPCRARSRDFATVDRHRPRSRNGRRDQPRWRRHRVCQSVFGRHSRNRFSADDAVLPVDDELAQVHGRLRRAPGDGPIGNRDRQSRIPGSGAHRAVHLAAQTVHLRRLKPIVWFRRTSTARARDFNWHNAIGFWCLIPIVIMTLSGAVISYPWASNLVYRLTGSPVPAARGGGRAGPATAAQGRSGPARGEGSPTLDRGHARTPGTAESGAALRGGAAPAGESARAGGETWPRSSETSQQRGPETGRRGQGKNQPRPAVIPAQLDRVWARAEQQVPTWSVLSMRLPNREGEPLAFTISDGAHWNAFARSNLTLNSANAEVIQWQPYEGTSLGQKARGWLRFAHTGELGGLLGQIIAGVGCLGGVFLVYTGLSLAFRRLWNWALWKRLRSQSRDPLGMTSSAASRETAME
ncbi:MAG: hypothetical protein GEU82_14510 [Luteitalea sp.]|nr:hypothetical protein [Luteitalea sp.]